MRPSLVFCLLLLSLLLAKAQGIRLEKGSLPVHQQKQQDEESTLMKRSDSEVQEAILCKDGQCRSTQKKRVSTVSRKSHNWLPHIHEDYYGPRHHTPRHH